MGEGGGAGVKVEGLRRNGTEEKGRYLTVESRLTRIYLIIGAFVVFEGDVCRWCINKRVYLLEK